MIDIKMKMKMKKIVLFAIAALFTTSVFAQESIYSTEKALKNTGFGDNWFIQGQIGGSYTMSENYQHASFFDLVSPHVVLGFGKYFSPQAGFRIQAGGWEAKSRYDDRDDTYKINYIQANLDGLLNLTNLVLPYRENRPFNLFAIFGIGYVHGFKDEDIRFEATNSHLASTNSIIPRAGLQADIRLTNDLSFNIEANGNLLPDKFNGVERSGQWDSNVNVLLGMTYKFNKKFENVDVIDPAVVQSLNDKVNNQLAQLRSKDQQLQENTALISDLERRLGEKPDVVEVASGSEVLMNAVVVFKIGSAQLQDNQEINIYNAAKYLQDNANVNVTVTGYADRATGNPTLNQRLSEQRAKAVADILVNKYGISRSRITEAADGDKAQPFQIDAWNRVVIFTATSK